MLTSHAQGDPNQIALGVCKEYAERWVIGYEVMFCDLFCSPAPEQSKTSIITVILNKSGSINNQKNWTTEARIFSKLRNEEFWKSYIPLFALNSFTFRMKKSTKL